MSWISSGLPVNKVLVLHAYSPGNTGDGLLVELAIENVREALGNVDVKVVALDAVAFQSLPEQAGVDYVPWGFWSGSRSLVSKVGKLATAVVGPPPEVRDLIGKADLIVAVGGGYMRGGTLIESLKSLGAHFGQLRLAARFGAKSLYMPQSVGPFLPVYDHLISAQLARLAAVYVRDNRSYAALCGIPGIVRAPDLAVMKVAVSARILSRPISGKPVLVARALHRPRQYTKFLRDAADSKLFDWAVQSTTSGNNDLPIIQAHGTGAPSPLNTYLGGDDNRIVVSTRLHGSMAALLNGRPTIHLSYERKGWGAFEDMGLGSYVLNARSATLTEVRSLLEDIEQDPKAYWAALDSARQNIVLAREGMLERIRSIASHRGSTLSTSGT